MADLLFGGFALMPGPVRKEKQFRIPDDFSKTHFTFLSRTCAVPRPVFPRFFDLCPEMAKLVKIIHKHEAKKFQHCPHR